MTEPNRETPAAAAGLRCPTCGARQEWSDACRRCQADLTLLRGLVEEYDRNRRLCLRHLAEGRPDEALARARRCLVLRADAEAARLVAVCSLLRGDWASALAMVVVHDSVAG